MQLISKSLKRPISLFVAVLLCAFSVLTFGGCEKRNSSALSLDGVDISNDVYSFFADEAFTKLGEDASLDSVTQYAKSKCTEYFKRNTLAHSEGISLSSAKKAAVSERVNAYWGIYGEYLGTLGISKETLTKIYTAESYRDALLVHYYGEDGEDEISVARLFASFRANYVVFRSINGYFTYVDANGLTQFFNETEKEALILKFQNMASLINAGEKSMEEAAEFLAETGYASSVVTVVLKKGEQGYPEGFFEKVQSLEARKASVIGTNEYIFLISRGDAGIDSEYYLDKREEILIDIVGDEIDTRIDEAFEPEATVLSGEAQAIYLTVKAARAN